MSREKQIREMERIGSRLPCDREDCSKCLAMNRRCNDYLFAERLYDAGYRKQSEVARKIISEIKQEISSCKNWDHIPVAVADALAKIEKEYTEV